MDAVGFLRQLPLAMHAHVHLFQMPNNPSREDAGLEGFSRLVEEYIIAKGLDRHPGGVVVGGCSMGGAVSLSLALRGRVKLRGLLLIGTFGSCQHLPRFQRFIAPLAWLIPVHLVHGIVGKRIARSKAFGEVSPEEIEWLVSIKQQRSQRYFGSAVAALTRQEQIAAARTLTIPTLVLHGTDDRVLPLAAGVELAENIPGAQFVQIDSAGHAVFFTHHQQTNNAIAAFIRGLKPPTVSENGAAPNRSGSRVGTPRDADLVASTAAADQAQPNRPVNHFP